MLSIFLATVGCDPDDPVDAGTDAAAIPDTGPPPSDAGTDSGPPDDPDTGTPCEGPPGLYEPGTGCTVIGAGFRYYEGAYALWADGADKERYIYLPDGQDIDSSDPDNWIFPVGTMIYKTFLIDGVRLETRLLEKTALGTGPSSWDMRVYAWNEDQDAVTEVTSTAEPERQNVLGTEHDIPSGSECIECHRSSQDSVNSFSAIMLNHDGDGVTLADLLAEGRLTDPPTLAEAVIPGTETEAAALGYLHANCGNCHRYTLYDTPPAAPECTDDDGRCGTCIGPACATGFRMWVRVQDVMAQDTDTFVTGIGHRAAFVEGSSLCRIDPGNPDTSVAILRMSRRGDIAQMPPLATEMSHAEGIAALRTFILGLTGDRSECTP